MFGNLPVGNMFGAHGVRGDFETDATEPAALREAMANRARWMLSWRSASSGELPDGVRIDGEPSLLTSGEWFPFTATDGTTGRVMIRTDSNGTYRIGSMTIEVDDDPRRTLTGGV